MSNAFTNWLSQSRSSYKDGTPLMKDYQHASRLYVDDTYAYSPKFGWIYFVSFNINREAAVDLRWMDKDSIDIGFLVKKIDLPKYNITTETLNQYNRKTVVQTKLNYTPVGIEFHDDNCDIINNLWINYYQHYYYDSNYGGSAQPGSPRRNENLPSYYNTKFGEIDYQYGRYNHNNTQDFFYSIDIYSLHQQQFTQYTLINPKITEWSHDSMNQNDNKVMTNKMNIAYENVLYNQGEIVPGEYPEQFSIIYYDNTKSPYGVAGSSMIPNYTQTTPSEFDKAQGRTYKVQNRPPSQFDKPGAARVFGKTGGNYKPKNPILDIATIIARNYVAKNGLGRVKGPAYSIAGSAFNLLSSGAGKYSEPPPSLDQPGILQLPGGVGINVFKALNTTVDGKTRANPSALILPKRGS